MAETKSYHLLCECGAEFRPQLPEEVEAFKERLLQFAGDHQKCGGIREYLDGKPRTKFAYGGSPN